MCDRWYGLLAVSTFSLVSLQSSDGMRVCVCVCLCMCVSVCVHACMSVCVHVCMH